MKIAWLIPVFVLIVTSCGEKPKEDVLDLKDIIPQSERYKEGDKKEEIKNESDFGFDMDLANDLGINVMEVDSFAGPMFPDRFNPNTRIKVDLQMKDGLISYRQWTFKDSLKTMNAFYNWLDCFGEKCRSFRYLQKARFQPESMLIFLNDTSITYISSELKLDHKIWQQYLEKRQGVDLWDDVLIQRKGAKVEWCYYGSLNGSTKKQFLPKVEE
jgi:hypothetical protein